MSGLQPQTLGVLAPQVWPEGHDGPQLTVPPQVSLIIPQLSVEGQPVSLVHPQTFGTPGFPAPQVWPAGQVPLVAPQVMGGQPGAVKVPQLSPTGHVVLQVGEQVFPSALQESPVGQLPQLIMPPQPFGAVPQICPVGQAVSGMQLQTLGVLAPQVWPIAHVPQLRFPPQPSGIVPQLSGVGHPLRGVQPHMFGVPPPPQVLPAGQEPLPHWPVHPSPAPHGLLLQFGVQPQTFFAPPPPQV